MVYVEFECSEKEGIGFFLRALWWLERKDRIRGSQTRARTKFFEYDKGSPLQRAAGVSIDSLEVNAEKGIYHMLKKYPYLEKFLEPLYLFQEC